MSQGLELEFLICVLRLIWDFRFHCFLICGVFWSGWSRAGILYLEDAFQDETQGRPLPWAPVVA